MVICQIRAGREQWFIVRVTELPIPQAYEFVRDPFTDSRGYNAFPFDASIFRQTTGFDFRVGQVNQSMFHAQVFRGIHWADVPPGQAKYVFCSAGVIVDYIVDLRVGSPLWGQVFMVELVALRSNALYLPEGVGHGALAVSEGAQLTYLCSTAYDPEREHSINPHDPQLKLDLPHNVILSERDKNAKLLNNYKENQLLPDYQECQAFYQAKLDNNAG